MTNDKPASGQSERGPVEFILRFLESAGGTAIVAAASALLFGQFLASGIQKKSAEEAFQREWMRTRGEQALVTHREYVERSLGAVDSAYRQVGGVLAASENLVLSCSREWDVRRFPRRQATKIRREKEDISRVFNQRVDTWDQSKYLCGFELDYYFGSQDSVVARSWREVVRAVDAHVHLAYHAYMHPPLKPAESAQADTLRATAVRAAEDAGAALRARRQYLWQGWDSPDTLRARLGIKD